MFRLVTTIILSKISKRSSPFFISMVTTQRFLFIGETLYSLLLKKLRKAPYWLLHFFHLQLFISLVSWPLLLTWGIPLSLATPLGNLIFFPFLMVFLLLSSLIFFCELVGVPNTLLIALLHFCSRTWTLCASFGQKSLMIACKTPPLYFLAGFVFLCFALLHARLVSKEKKSIGFFVALFCSTLLFIRATTQSAQTLELDVKGKMLTIQRYAGRTIVIDNGSFSHCARPESAIAFQIIPELTTKYGISTLDTYILLKPSTRSFDAITTFLRRFSIKEVFMPRWQGTLSRLGWQAWHDFLCLCKEKRVRVHLIDREAVIAHHKEKMVLTALKEIKKNGLRYHPISMKF